MALDIFLQNDTQSQNTPPELEQQLRHWIHTTLSKNNSIITDGEITIRIVSLDESHELNRTYRNKEGPTNVLSFSYDESDYFIADLAICAELVAQEAIAQKKTLIAHWAHLVIHGTLHLMGHDHEDPVEAEIMETLEIKIMLDLGFDHPYL